jgi:hypothetical protein
MASRGVRRREALGDWYYASHLSGLRRLRAILATPLTLLVAGGSAAAIGAVSLIGVALVGGIDSTPESLPGATPSTSLAAGLTDSALDAGSPEVAPNIEPFGTPVPLLDGPEVIYGWTVTEDGEPILIDGWAPIGFRLARGPQD